MQELKGSFVALVTPMKSNGEIDLPTLKELVEWHIESGTHGVVSVGTTGESATLNFNDHVKVLEKTISYIDNKIVATQPMKQLSLTKLLAQLGMSLLCQ